MRELTRAAVLIVMTMTAVVVMPWIGTAVLAHEMTVQGTVAAIERTRIQITTGQEEAGEPSSWYPIDAKTTIKRGSKTVPSAEAKISVGERVVAIVDHPAEGPLRTKEIRLAAR
jgi:hypothetical protein